jgi:hypothetical protein
MKELNIEFYCEDLGKTVTIRNYLKELLLTLWEEGESFSGKRPFGNSGWEYDLYKPLIENNIIDGKIDEDGFICDYNANKADEVIINCIKSL